MSAAPRYEEARQVAGEGEAESRAALAAAPATPPEILYFLAEDKVAAVRGAVAGNGATPALANRLLAADADPAVRVALGRKLAALAPELSEAAQDRLRQMSWETLCLLVEDTAVVVRAAIAEVLQDMPDAPRELILKLARDTEMPVAEPVIKLSPLLTEADLLALVGQPPVAATVTAVARRPGISEAVTDAIIARADAGAVLALLSNPAAAIRESALDALVAGAARHLPWHSPLVQRPGLSSRAVLALGSFVADQLLRILAARPDLSPEVTAELKLRVDSRVKSRLTAPPPRHIPWGGPASAAPEPPATEAAFDCAGRQGDTAAMASILARAAKLPAEAVRQAVALRSAKGLVSLCWKAGFAPRSSAAAQLVLGQLSRDAALRAAPDGGWPLQPPEMEWQLELLANLDD